MALRLFATALCVLSTASIANDVTLKVYADGSGDFISLAAAISFLAPGSNPNLGAVTLLLRGTFRERLRLYSNFTNGVTIIGDGVTPDDAAVITYNVSGSTPGVGTFNSWTVLVEAPFATFVNLTIANSADNYNHSAAGQSVALALGGGGGPDCGLFACFNCSLYGGQDTFYSGGYAARSYFEGGYVNGSVDALFGASSTVWNGTTIEMSDTVTAHKGAPSGTPTAYLFLGCTVKTIPGAVLLLGRPWAANATVVWKDTWMDAGVQPPGWQDWQHGCTAAKHPPTWCDWVTYAEWNTTGPGAAHLDQRVWWSKQLTAVQADQWTKEGVLRGWVPVLPGV